MLVLLIVDGTFHWMQNILAFTLMKIVNPLTYSVANVTKRIAVISGSLVMMKNEVHYTTLPVSQDRAPVQDPG